MIISSDNFGRENAIILYKNKVYEDVNHQCALELALNSEGKSMNLNLEGMDIFKAEQIVDEQCQNKLISTWHWYYDNNVNYLICNFEDDFFNNYNSNTIKKYAKKNRMGLGYHTNQGEVNLYDDTYINI